MCKGVLVQVFWRERERSTFVSGRMVPPPPYFCRYQPFTDVSNQCVSEERAVGCLATFRYINFPSFSHVLSTRATAFWISLSSHLSPPPPSPRQLLGSSMCLVAARSTPTTGAIPTPETRQLSNVRNLTYSTGGLSLSWSAGRV
jgi:hypothetical protein